MLLSIPRSPHLVSCKWHTCISFPKWMITTLLILPCLMYIGYISSRNIFLCDLWRLILKTWKSSLTSFLRNNIQPMSFKKAGYKIYPRNSSKVQVLPLRKKYCGFRGLYHQGLSQGLFHHKRKINYQLL